MINYTEEYNGIQSNPHEQEQELLNLGQKNEKNLDFLGIIGFKSDVNTGLFGLLQDLKKNNVKQYLVTSESE